MLVAAAAVTPPVAFAWGVGPGEVSLSQLAFQDFSRLAGSVFRVFSRGEAVAELQLTRARPAALQNAGFEQFSLFFRGPTNPALSQDSYAFWHPGIGGFAMFIAPVGNPDPAAAFYEAVFNRPAAITSPAQPAIRSRRSRMALY